MSRPPQKITSLYAWVATEADGGEGVPASRIDLDGRTMFMPLLGADIDRVKSLRGEAIAVKVTSGVRMRLCRFQLADELEEL